MNLIQLNAWFVVGKDGRLRLATEREAEAARMHERGIESCPVCGGFLEHLLGCPEMDRPR